MSQTQADLNSYFAAVRALRSDDPSVRGPAITALVELARQGMGPVRARAARVVTEEFGPYALSEGLPACTAPVRIVEECECNCRSCVWLWLDQQPPTVLYEDVPAAVLQKEHADQVARI